MNIMRIMEGMLGRRPAPEIEIAPAPPPGLPAKANVNLSGDRTGGNGFIDRLVRVDLMGDPVMTVAQLASSASEAGLSVTAKGISFEDAYEQVDFTVSGGPFSGKASASSGRIPEAKPIPEPKRGIRRLLGR